MFSVKRGLSCNISRQTALYLAFESYIFSNIQSCQFLIVKREKRKQSPWLKSK